MTEERSVPRQPVYELTDPMPETLESVRAELDEAARLKAEAETMLKEAEATRARAHADANGGVSRTANVSTANVPTIVLTSAILEPGERSLLHRASRIMSKSDLAAGTLIDAIEDALRRAHSVLAE